ncbi:polysaccharide deacetylase family protein [Flavobacteriaceae bacterium]|nr:polysaccharide deacetylase family protein [Flavobacteriaceae bacterium]
MSLVIGVLLSIIAVLMALILSVYAYFNYKQLPIYDVKLALKVLFGKTDYTPYKGLEKKLGYSSSDKLLIIHADDLGLAGSVNKATFDALEKGGVNSASIMANCKYIDEVKKYSIKNPNIDLGVHLTVTNEWKNYRWKSLMPAKESQTLVNSVGEFPIGIKKFVLKADPTELKKELQAQINKIKSLGIKPTHIDSHEGALFFNKEHFRVYLEVGEENKLPVFVPRGVDAHFGKGFPKPKNVVVIKDLYMARKGLKKTKWKEFYLNTIRGLKPGISQLIVHLSYDDNEMREISIDHPDYGAKWRHLDYEAVTNISFKKALKQNDIKLVTWKEIQKVLY